MSALDVSVQNLAVSHIWFGDHQVLFVELGALSASTRVRKDGSLMNPTGEVSVEFHDGWQVESHGQILCGSKSEASRAVPVVERLVGRQVVALRASGSPPEVEVELTERFRLKSLRRNEEEPDWAVADRRGFEPRWFGVRGGELRVGSGGPQTE
jgi:hypothetical protein